MMMTISYSLSRFLIPEECFQVSVTVCRRIVIPIVPHRTSKHGLTNQGNAENMLKIAATARIKASDVFLPPHPSLPLNYAPLTSG
jgi:hypothetical protein